MSNIKIGNVIIEKIAALAPMASVADKAFRHICKEFGASYVVSEMASSKAMYFSDKKTADLIEVTDYERPMAIQIFGDDPKFMGLATYDAMNYKPDILDINMGCPVPKVAGNGSGAALMKNPLLASEIIKQVVNVSTVPVTVKIRKGWDDDSVNAVDFAKMVEQAGASAVCVHGRTRKQMYSGKADLDIIRQVKQNISIPVIGNGDIDSGERAKHFYEYTGCDLVMIGRGTYGNPFIFEEITCSLKGLPYQMPTFDKKLETMKHHIQLLCEFKGEKVGMQEARKHVAWYIKGIKNAAKFRNLCGKLTTFDDLYTLINEVKSQNE